VRATTRGAIKCKCDLGTNRGKKEGHTVRTRATERNSYFSNSILVTMNQPEAHVRVRANK
jgi:hypothetical protein